MTRLKRILPFILVLNISVAVAQDMQFSQFYAAPTYLNPALTGANVCSRLSTNYRNQWPDIPGAFVSYVVSYDHYAQDLNSGFGILLTKDQAGSGKLRNTTINLLYAYDLALTKELSFRAGFQASQNFRDVNMNDLLFGDQIARDFAATSVEPIPAARVAYFDVSTGGLLFTKKHWFGFAAHHLNVPNQSLFDKDSPVPSKYSFHGGTKISLNDEDADKDEIQRSISPAFNYKWQGKFDQVDIGTYYSHGVLDLGIWYRGIPLLKAYRKGYANNDAFALLAGVTIERLKLGYSYDFTFSKLIGSTSGAHEISLSYQFCKLKKKRRSKTRTLLVPCPKF